MKGFSIFTRHPASVGETYAQHFVSASGFAWRMLQASLACMIHALLPFLFQRTGSTIIADLHTRMIAARHRATKAPLPQPHEQASR